MQIRDEENVYVADCSDEDDSPSRVIPALLAAREERPVVIESIHGRIWHTICALGFRGLFARGTNSEERHASILQCAENQ